MMTEEIAFSPVSLALRPAILSDGLQQRFNGGAGEGLGRLLASLGAPTGLVHV